MRSEIAMDVDLAQRATVQAVVDQMDALVTRMKVEAAQVR